MSKQAKPSPKANLRSWLQAVAPGRAEPVAPSNVTDHKRAEKALRASEVQYRQLYESMRDAFVRVDMAGHILEFNEAYRDMLGYEEEELRALTHVDLVPEKWRAIEAEIVDTQILARGYSDVYEKEYRRKDGTLVPVELRTNLLRDEEGKPVGMWAIVRDITERKRMEEELERSARQWQTTFDGVSSAVCLMDAKARIIRCNDATAKLVGKRADQCLGLTCCELLHGSKHPIADCPLARACRSLRREITELRIGQQWIEVTVDPLAAKDGSFASAVHIVTDITDRKRAEEALRKRDEIIRYILKYDPNAIAVFDLGLHYIAVSERYLHDYGVKEENIIGKHHYEVFPEIPQKWKDVHQRCLAGAVERNNDDSFQRPDGSITYNRWECRPWYREDGTIGGIVTYTEVTTDRKRVEQALRESEARYRAITAALTDYIYTVRVKDGQATETLHGEACVAVTGYTPQEYRDNPNLWIEMVPPEDRPALLEHTRQFLSGQEVGALEHRIVRKCGDVRWVRNTLLRHVDSQGRTVSYDGLVRDITEYRRMQVQFAQAQKMESVGLLAGGIAHDFRNQLTVIKGYGEMLLRRDMVHDKAREYVQEILKAADRSAEISGQLLAFSRQQELHPEVVSLDGAIASLSNSLTRILGEDVRLAIMPSRNLGSVNIDTGQFQQAIMNLVVNARDAMPQGGQLTIETDNVDLDEDFAMSHPGASAGPHVMVAVTDTGVGMNAATLARVFEPFFTTKPVGQGTGLGLSMVYGFVKQSGGYVSVYSEPGRGTTFMIYLPRLQEGVAPAKRAAAPADLPHHGTGTILLVEDEEAVRQVVSTTLRECGYTVLVAENSQDALSLGAHYDGKIDLLMTDVVMPEMGGPQIAAAILTSRPGIPVLYMSGYTGRALANQGVVPRDVNLLVKPFNPGALLKAVGRLLEPKAA
ncbi:MAG: PAS domain S-box protein [Phycisphaerae bacterium]|jgi:PAS domain S-box-containing protein